MLFRRGKIYWYKIKFAGRVYRESTKSTNVRLAERAERKRHQQLEESYNGITLERQQPQLFSVAADEWLELKEHAIAPKSYAIEKCNLKHLRKHFGQRLLCDISAETISRYISHRRNQGAADKTIKLECGTLRGILKRGRVWAHIRQDDAALPKLKDREDVGRALTREEETTLLAACAESRSRGLYTAVVLALNTGMRESEIRLLRWNQVDLDGRCLRVGKSKTSAGDSRPIPLNDRAMTAIRIWANKFPDRKPTHCVFPAERYGVAGDDAVVHAYELDARKPIGSWKKAWETVRDETHANVQCRFHDLRHTAITRMLEGGTPLAVIGALMGWSAGTAMKMAKRYGHISGTAQRDAVALLDIKTGKSVADEEQPTSPQAVAV